MIVNSGGRLAIDFWAAQKKAYFSARRGPEFLQGRSRKRAARTWPATRGLVDHVDVHWMVGQKCYYAAQVGYSYQVGGHRYSGSLASRCANEDAGRKFVEGLKNKPLVVRYHPNRPAENVLFIDENPMFKRATAALHRPSLN